MTFEVIKQNYVRGLWNERLVKVAVEKGIITQEQYEEIISTPLDH